MQLKGTHTLRASPQEVWNLIMDTSVLAKIIPGVSKLERIEGDLYNAISEVKMGPVKGSFKGDLEVADKKEPESFNLHVKQKSKIGNANATLNIKLQPTENQQTELSFDGKAKLSGTLARTGNRVLSGVANTMTKQFFSALEKEIESSKSSKTQPILETTDKTTTSTSPTDAPQKPSSLWTRFINWLKKLLS